MNAVGVLLPDSNIAELTKHALLELNGICDEWINSVVVKKAAAGRAPADQDIPDVF